MLQTATHNKHCNTLQHNATHCNTLQHTATHCNTLQHTATHCNTLHHTATRECSANAQHIAGWSVYICCNARCGACCGAYCSVCCSVFCSACCSSYAQRTWKTSRMVSRDLRGTLSKSEMSNSERRKRSILSTSPANVCHRRSKLPCASTLSPILSRNACACISMSALSLEIVGLFQWDA